MKIITFTLNLPYTIIGLFLWILSWPIDLPKFILKPTALIFKIKSFWWTFGYAKNARAMCIGHVVLLSPDVEACDLEHELVHIEQYQRLPFVFPFYYYYELLQNGYVNNKYEIEAYRSAGNKHKQEVKKL